MVTIDVSEPVWKELLMKKQPGDSFDDVLRRKLGLETPDTMRSESESEGEHEARKTNHRREPEPPGGVEKMLREMDVGRDLEEHERAVTHAVEAVEWLRHQNGSRSRQEVIEHVYPEDAGVTPDTWWRKRAMKGFKKLAEHELVEQDGRKWRWVGD